MCYANIELSGAGNTATCEYCGTKVVYTDDKVGGAVEAVKKAKIETEMVLVRGGTFTREVPRLFSKKTFNVAVSDFYIGKYVVPQKLWVQVMGGNPSKFKGDNLPVEQVSWNDAQEFIAKLNSMTGKQYRLPTEAEWEYAARGGERSHGYMYAGSNNLDDVAWHTGNSGSKTRPVGVKAPNELGIYDMSGNVFELCGDWSGKYRLVDETNPKGPDLGSTRVMRGGCWLIDAEGCRVSFRGAHVPDYRYYYVGFRLAFSP